LVSLNFENKKEEGMDFKKFCFSIFNISLIAFREKNLKKKISNENKVFYFLNYAT
jgi:hypothetical protein